MAGRTEEKERRKNLNKELIYKQAAIDALDDEPEVWCEDDEYALGLNKQWHYDVNALKALPPAQPEPCENAVSRKAVEEMLKNGFPARGMWEIEGDVVKQTVCETLADALMGLDRLPSVTPKQQWIPVTKDTLPEEGKVVIVKGLKGTWDVGTYRGYDHIMGLEDIHLWYWKKNTLKKVYWWMYKDGALPEPYKEEGEG